MNTLKERLVYARGVRGLSQGELARLAKCSQSTIGNVESGERDTLRNLVMVARVLNCSADWLYDGFGVKPVKGEARHPEKGQPIAAEAREHAPVSYLQTKTDPMLEDLFGLFSQLDEEGKKQWLSDLRGFVRGRSPHTVGTALRMAEN